MVQPARLGRIALRCSSPPPALALGFRTLKPAGLCLLVALGGAGACSADQPSGGVGGAQGTDGSSPLGPVIVSFRGDKLWGDAPLVTNLIWQIDVSAATALECQLDADGDGAFETVLPNCPAFGSQAVTLSKIGAIEPKLRVMANGKSAEMTELIYVNHIDWVPNIVRVGELPGLLSSSATDTQVTLTFQNTGSVPPLKIADVLFDRSADGYVRKVTSFAKAGATIVVMTTPGSLQDVATSGFYGMRNAGDAVKPLSGGSECDPMNWSGSWIGAFVGLPKVELTQGPFSMTLDNGRIGGGIWVKEAVFDFNPFHFVVRIDLHTKSALCADFATSVAGGWDPVPLDIPVPTLGQKVSLGFIEAKAGLIPKVGISVLATIELSAGLVASVETSARFNFEPGTALDTAVSIVPHISLDNPQVSFEGEAKVFFDPAVELTWAHPPKDCKPGTKAGADLRVGLDPEVGFKATITKTSGNPEVCIDAVLYGEASAEAIPPFGIFECVKISAPLFPDKKLLNPPICFPSSDGGPDAGGCATGTMAVSPVNCAVDLPQGIDVSTVNLVVTLSGASSTAANVPDAASCNGGSWWYYDDPNSPKAIELCPALCTAINADPGAKVEILLGCATIIQ